MDNYIYETAVYCGAHKHWRVLNLNSGTLYSMQYQSEKSALKSIKEGEERSGKIVRKITLLDLRVSIPPSQTKE